MNHKELEAKLVSLANTSDSLPAAKRSYVIRREILKAFDTIFEKAIMFAHWSADGCGCEHNKADPGCPVPCVPCQAREFIKENQ